MVVRIRYAAAEIQENALFLEVNHELDRRQQFKKDHQAKKIFDVEREKGIGLFLEEQEKWDLVREKGLMDYRKQKKQRSPQEGSADHNEHIIVKQAEARTLEAARKEHMQARQRVRRKLQQFSYQDESQELGLIQNRPRFDLRVRGKNKWVKNSSSSSSGSSPSSSVNYPAPMPPAFDQFRPQPIGGDGFEDFPPPPPFGGFDNTGGIPYSGDIDSGFGDFSPPPPPTSDYDF